MELLHSKNKKGKKEKEKEVEDAKSRGIGVVEAVRIRGIILFSKKQLCEWSFVYSLATNE